MDICQLETVRASQVFGAITFTPLPSLSENASFCERILLQMLIYELSTDSFQFLFRAKAYVCSLLTFSFLRSKADEVVEGN